MKANRIKMDKINEKCNCVYEVSSLGVKWLVRSCQRHKNPFYKNMINSMSRAQEDIIAAQPKK